MTRTPIRVTRDQILAFRRTTGHLEQRLPPGKRSLREIAWAGLQDSMPRAAVLAVNARMGSTEAAVWEDPAFVQVWGPRYSVFVVAARDIAVFTLGRLPETSLARNRADDIAARLRSLLDGREMRLGEAGAAIGVDSNALRYAAPTGTVLLRWDGARQPTIWTVPPPAVDPADARKELVHRFLHVYGPSTPEAFSAWAGVPVRSAASRFEKLRRSLTPVGTPIGPAWILNRDLDLLRSPPDAADQVRLLPSGDAYYLLQGKERDLLVPRSECRSLLWTSRVWPGAILAAGEIVGTWRRAGNRVTAEPWVRLSKRVRAAIEAEATSLPLPDDGARSLRWAD